MAVTKSKKKAKYDLSGLKGVKVTSPKFVTSFPKLFKPEAFQEGAKPAYSVVMLFKKTADLKEMKQAVTRAKVEAFGKDKEAWPDIESPWRDGDEKSDYAGFEGMTYANAKTYNRPLVIDRSKDKIEDADDVYAGCIGRASLVAKAVESAGKYFITFYLQAYQKVEDGEPLGGGGSKDDFEDIEDDEDLDADDIDSDDDEDTEDEDEE